jgi:ABC-2 type transport system permease protein
MVGVPCVLMALLRYIYDGQPLVFERVGPMLLAIFPFVVMFVVTSVAMLRERTSGTLDCSSPSHSPKVSSWPATPWGSASPP